MTLEEILALEDIDQKIEYLKKGRKTPMPNSNELWDEWNPDRHPIMINKELFPDREVLIEEKKEGIDTKGNPIEIPAKYKTEPINRIPLPLEQDIVNIQTAFTVGTEPALNCDPQYDAEENLFSALKHIFRKNKIKYQNKRIVRAWLAETEVAEYWYAVKDDSFWAKIMRKAKKTFGGKVKPSMTLRSVIWSPFRGDKLYPFFENEDYLALSREYKKKDINGQEITCFMTVTSTHVYQWEQTDGWHEVKDKTFKHGFEKNPSLYAWRAEPYCRKIKPIRERLEKLLSSFGDCIDYHFFPILMLFGDVGGLLGKTKDRMVKLEGEGANAQYLVWQQAPDVVKYEAETLTNQAYDLTNTPRISFSVLKGFSGNAPSGDAFKFLFMGAHMAVSNHAEVIGEFLQRRVNFLVSALGSINPSEYMEASKTIDIETEIVPYMIDNLSEKVTTAVKASGGPIWSTKEGIMFAGNADRVDEEMKLIKDEQETREKNAQNIAY